MKALKTGAFTAIESFFGKDTAAKKIFAVDRFLLSCLYLPAELLKALENYVYVQ